jgi:hypothetical protein
LLISIPAASCQLYYCKHLSIGNNIEDTLVFTFALVLLILMFLKLYRPPSCLVPGAGLGRLALDISSLGTVIKFLM